MRSVGWTFTPYRRPPLRAALAVTTAVGSATLLWFVHDVSTTVAALVYLLAVVAATAVGGQIAGLLAAPLSFLALNFFFTRPRYMFAVDKPEDLLALVVFLAVSLTVGTLLALALSSRDRMQLRELEARLMSRLSTHLLSGEPIEDGLQQFARALVEMFDLSFCQIDTIVTKQPISAFAKGVGNDGARMTQSMVAKGRDIGSLTIAAKGSSLSAAQREAAEVFARQMAVALEGVRLSDEARQAQLEIEATRLRAALFSSVTHDLRTPLASITTAVTSLLEPDATFSERQRSEHLITIREEAQRLNRLVGNLLNLSRIRAGALVPTPVEASIAEVVESVLRRLRSQLQGREVIVDIPDEIPEISLDVMQIDQVLTNLIENAIKFSPPASSISVSVAGWQRAIRVRIANAGQKIERKDRERLFEPFVRGEGHIASGTGLGLAIARAIVVAHGGRIWIDDAPAGGIAITFELPNVPVDR